MNDERKPKYRNSTPIKHSDFIKKSDEYMCINLKKATKTLMDSETLILQVIQNRFNDFLIRHC